MSSPNFLIYDASAGSGKTFTLTKEYLKILLASSNNDAYKKILAITFTNKAVNEMKHRIVSSLMEFAKDNPSESALGLLKKILSDFDEIGFKIDQQEIKNKSKLIIKNIIHNYASFDISTIDKFTHRLIRTFAIDLDLPVTFEISLDKKSIIKEAVDRIIAKAGTDELLTALLIDFALGKVNENGSWDFTRELLSIGGLIGDENHDKELNEIKNISLENFIEIRNDIYESRNLILDDLKNKAQNLLAYITNQPYGIGAFKVTLPGQLNKILAKNFKAAAFLKTFNYPDRSNVENKIYVKSLSAVEPDIDYIFDEIQKINKAIGHFLMYDNIAKNVTPLSLLNSIANEVKLIQEEQNILSISEFNKIINNEIQNQPAPYIYERLGDRYKHFFIDEFQDTSDMQWKNVIPLIDNALSGYDDEGKTGSLMLVGDAKQSIYRWRGGKAEQFIDLSKNDESFNPFSNPNRKLNQLDTNYRSYSEVIGFNNSFFKQISSKLVQPDYIDLYLNKSSQKINDKIGGFVSIDFIEDPKKINNEKEDGEENVEKDALYLDKTIQIISKCKEQGFNYGDIALLTRRRDKGVVLANFLIENGIPIISSETLLLSNSDDVNFIVNVLRILNNFNDKDAKFNILYYIKTNYISIVDTHNFVFLGLQQKNESDLEYYIQQNTSITFSFINNRKQDLYQVCENIISVFLLNKSNIAYVQYFLDIVLEQEVKQLGLDEFLSFWDNKKESLSIPSPENVDAVQIMTVHKSKGLEFPVVIFPFVNDKIIRSTGDKMWIDIPEASNFKFSKTLIDKKAEVVAYNSQVSDLYEITNDKMMLDTINVLYVALTRAGEQLYIISEKKEVKSSDTGYETNSVASFFIEFLQNLKIDITENGPFTFGESKKVSISKLITNSNIKIETVKDANLKSDAIKITQKEALMWGSKRGESIEFGNLLHELLSQIEYVTDLDFTVEQALRKGRLEYKNYETVKYILKNIVKHPDLSDHFNPSALVFNERNIININFSTIKPDRVTIYDGNATLLDYKTGKKSEAHINQVLDYEKALSEMGYKVTKKTLVYISEKIEEIVNL